jgi:hypothetical protein
MFSAGSGLAVATMRVNLSMRVSVGSRLVLARHQRSYISQVTADCGRGDHRRRHDMRARHALAAAKVRIGGGAAAFAFGNPDRR